MTHHQEPWILSREGLDPDERSDKTIAKQNIANYVKCSNQMMRSGRHD